MEHGTDLAAAIESAVGSLVAVLESASLAQTPAIPPTQLRVLTIIAAGGTTNMNRLAETLKVVPSSASRLCDRLEATGLLHRAADPRDRREVQLLLTAAARQLLDELQARRREALGAVLDRMPVSQRQELLRSLTAFSLAAGTPAGAADRRSA